MHNVIIALFLFVLLATEFLLAASKLNHINAVEFHRENFNLFEQDQKWFKRQRQCNEKCNRLTNENS